MRNTTLTRGKKIFWADPGYDVIGSCDRSRGVVLLLRNPPAEIVRYVSLTKELLQLLLLWSSPARVFADCLQL